MSVTTIAGDGSGGLIRVRNAIITSLNISSNAASAVSKPATDAGDIGFKDAACGQRPLTTLLRAPMFRPVSGGNGNGLSYMRNKTQIRKGTIYSPTSRCSARVNSQ